MNGHLERPKSHNCRRIGCHGTVNYGGYICNHDWCAYTCSRYPNKYSYRCDTCNDYNDGDQPYPRSVHKEQSPSIEPKDKQKSVLQRLELETYLDTNMDEIEHFVRQLCSSEDLR